MHIEPNKTDKEIAVWLFVGFLALYTAVTRGHFYLSDEVQVFQQTRSLWERGDLSVTPSINTVRGRDGQHFAQYGIGQSVLALPFYLTGKAVHQYLERAGAKSWIKTFEGPAIGDPDKRWGGEVEIFFVNLFCAFILAALLAVFFLFNIRLGATPAGAIAATIVLGLTTHVAGFAVEFLQHPAEALFLLMTFYFLFIDSTVPNWRYRCAAGSMAGVMLLVRASSLVLIAALTAYLFWHALKRSRIDKQKSWLTVLTSSVPFLVPVMAAILVTVVVNQTKWGEYSFSGSYRAFNSFTNSWLVSLYGYLFSPGQSIFIFSPILILAPLYFRPFVSKYPAETCAIFGLTTSYALFYGRSLAWHGQWCFGPRYLMAMIPLLLLPFATWLNTEKLRTANRTVLLGAVPLAIVGVFIEVLHIAVNVSYVYFHEGYNKLVPHDSYIFIPQICQIVTHSRALVACDDRVDLWLVNVGREIGRRRVIEILSVLFALLLASVLQMRRTFKGAARPVSDLDPPFVSPAKSE